ncbi:LOW QUALITY PROTEIN: THAP domain-containing protein 5-like [Rhinoraja longicauda]
MKRESWLPSKHQGIRCEHFTADSIEWRWGTRCLKSCVTLTIFSFPSHPQNKKPNSRHYRKKNVLSEGTSEARAETFRPTATGEISGERPELSLTVGQSKEHLEITSASGQWKFTTCCTTHTKSTLHNDTRGWNEPVLNHEQSVATGLLQVEHSYCRQDTVKAQLWGKLSRLQKKIKRLQQQEERTATDLKRMETLVEHLKQENFISEVKMKVMETCFTQFELTDITVFKEYQKLMWTQGTADAGLQNKAQCWSNSASQAASQENMDR